MGRSSGRKAKALLAQANGRLDQKEDSTFQQNISSAKFYEFKRYTDCESEVERRKRKTIMETVDKLEGMLRDKQYEQAIVCASDLIKSFQPLSLKYQCQVVTFSQYEIEAYFYRAKAYYKLSRLEPAIEDATTALRMVSTHLDLLSLQNPDSSEFSLRDNCAVLKKIQFRILLQRSMACEDMGDLDGSLADLRAAAALEVLNQLEGLALLLFGREILLSECLPRVPVLGANVCMCVCVC